MLVSYVCYQFLHRDRLNMYRHWHLFIHIQQPWVAQEEHDDIVMSTVAGVDQQNTSMKSDSISLAV